MEIILFAQGIPADELQKLFAENLQQEEISLQVKENGGNRADATLVAGLVQGGAALLSALITAAVMVWQTNKLAKQQRIVIKDKNGNRYELPADATPEQIRAFREDIERKQPQIHQIGLFNE